MPSLEPDDSRTLTRYLLGLLSDEEATAIEARYFEDEGYFARLEVAADDLAARYLASALSRGEEERFRSHCLGSHHDQLRLRVTRALSARAHSQTAASRTARPSWIDNLGLCHLPRLAAATAGIALVVTAGLLSWRLFEVRAERDALRTELADAQAASRAAAGSDERARQERAGREAALRKLAALTQASFVLVAGTERGGGSVIVVPSALDVVRLDLALDRPLSGRYRVIVRTPERAQVWSSEIDVVPDAASATAVVPAAVLPPAQYEAVLHSLPQRGASVEVGVYGFTVTRSREEPEADLRDK